MAGFCKHDSNYVSLLSRKQDRREGGRTAKRREGQAIVVNRKGDFETKILTENYLYIELDSTRNRKESFFKWLEVELCCCSYCSIRCSNILIVIMLRTLSMLWMIVIILDLRSWGALEHWSVRCGDSGSLLSRNRSCCRREELVVG
jgi:hypothetical protein